MPQSWAEDGESLRVSSEAPLRPTSASLPAHPQPDDFRQHQGLSTPHYLTCYMITTSHRESAFRFILFGRNCILRISHLPPADVSFCVCGCFVFLLLAVT